AITSAEELLVERELKIIDKINNLQKKLRENPNKENNQILSDIWGVDRKGRTVNRNAPLHNGAKTETLVERGDYTSLNLIKRVNQLTRGKLDLTKDIENLQIPYEKCLAPLKVLEDVLMKIGTTDKETLRLHYNQMGRVSSIVGMYDDGGNGKPFIIGGGTLEIENIRKLNSLFTEYFPELKIDPKRFKQAEKDKISQNGFETIEDAVEMMNRVAIGGEVIADTRKRKSLILGPIEDITDKEFNNPYGSGFPTLLSLLQIREMSAIPSISVDGKTLFEQLNNIMGTININSPYYHDKGYDPRLDKLSDLLFVADHVSKQVNSPYEWELGVQINDSEIQIGKRVIKLNLAELASIITEAREASADLRKVGTDKEIKAANKKTADEFDIFLSRIEPILKFREHNSTALLNDEMNVVTAQESGIFLIEISRDVIKSHLQNEMRKAFIQEKIEKLGKNPDAKSIEKIKQEASKKKFHPNEKDIEQELAEIRKLYPDILGSSEYKSEIAVNVLQDGSITVENSPNFVQNLLKRRAEAREVTLEKVISETCERNSRTLRLEIAVKPEIFKPYDQIALDEKAQTFQIRLKPSGRFTNDVQKKKLFDPITDKMSQQYPDIKTEFKGGNLIISNAPRELVTKVAKALQNQNMKS
ncbi:MAG TPA: hypothetical protein DIV86_04910, partial [Alphaproteobacteria bacterium]|nr:hypothetical protein [Alphaproteobacteria bacterium]